MDWVGWSWGACKQANIMSNRLTYIDQPRGTHILFYAIILHAFLQLLTDFVEQVYVQTVLVRAQPTPWSYLLLLFFAPLLLLVFQRGIHKVGLRVVGTLFLLARLSLDFWPPMQQMWVAGAGVGLFLMLWPTLLWRPRRSLAAVNSVEWGLGLALAVLLSALARTWLASGAWALLTQDVFTAVLIFSAFVTLFVITNDGRVVRRTSPTGVSATPRKLFLLSVGLVNTVTLIYFSYSAPNVVARWSDWPYEWLITAMMGMMLVYALLASNTRWFDFITNRVLLLGLNGLFITAVVMNIFLHQASFPLFFDYAYLPPPLANWLEISTLVGLMLYPVLFINFTLFTRELIMYKRTPATNALGFALGGAIMLALIVSHIMTTHYADLPLFGEWFRGRYWLVYLATGILAAGGMWLVRGPSFLFRRLVSQVELTFGYAVVVLVLGVVVAGGAWQQAGLIQAGTAGLPTGASGGKLTAVSLNIQFGYDQQGQRSHLALRDLLRELDPDVIALQASDTNRISTGNRDVVRFLANELGYDSYYGPPTVNGTAGVALLSRYPLSTQQTYYLFSPDRQTSLITAEIMVKGQTFVLANTQLGTTNTLDQQRAVLQALHGRGPLLLLGEFNFSPRSEAHQRTTAQFNDAWLVRWPSGVSEAGQTNLTTVGHAFISPDLTVTNIQYITPNALPKPMLYVELTVE